MQMWHLPPLPLPDLLRVQLCAGGLFQRPCKNLRLSYHYMLIARRRLSYRSSQLTNDHDFLWKAPVAQNVSQPMSCLNR